MSLILLKEAFILQRMFQKPLGPKCPFDLKKYLAKISKIYLNTPPQVGA